MRSALGARTGSKGAVDDGMREASEQRTILCCAIGSVRRVGVCLLCEHFFKGVTPTYRVFVDLVVILLSSRGG